MTEVRNEAREMIRKYGIVLHEGTQLKINNGKNLSQQVQAQLRAMKAEIFAELERQAEESRSVWEAKKAELVQLTTEYQKTVTHYRCFTILQKDNMVFEHGISTLILDGNTFYLPKYGNSSTIVLPHRTNGMALIQTNKSTYFGSSGVAWAITPEMEVVLIAEQKLAVIEKERNEKITAEKAEQKEVEARIAAAKEMLEKRLQAVKTGKPVLLRRWTEECCDPREECSSDIHTESICPDGSIKHSFYHTW